MATARRAGFTLLELLVALAVVAVIVALAAAAVQKVRAAAARSHCQHNLRQVALALLHYHEATGSLPPGYTSAYASHQPAMPHAAWSLRVAPHLEQEALWRGAVAAYARDPFPFHVPPHTGHVTPVAVYQCPSDDRVRLPQTDETSGELVALTSYLGVSGVQAMAKDGVLFADSRVRLADITDGTSNTLMVGERPPSKNYQFGWWYAGRGQLDDGCLDSHLGVREVNIQPVVPGSCGPGTYKYKSGRPDNQCSVFHFWSLHPGGANFTLADGSVRLVRYEAVELMPALASRRGGESATLPD